MDARLTTGIFNWYIPCKIRTSKDVFEGPASYDELAITAMDTGQAIVFDKDSVLKLLKFIDSTGFLNVDEGEKI